MKQDNPKESVSVNIGGNVTGQVAVGDHVTQTQTVQSGSREVSAAELETLRQMFAELKAQISASVPPEQQEKALEKASELESAITAEKPDLTTMEYVKNWFGKNLPQLAGAVTSLVVNPIVGKLVEVAGEALSHEFRRRFGVESAVKS